MNDLTWAQAVNIVNAVVADGSRSPAPVHSPDELVANLRGVRRSLGMSQRDLAELIGTQQSAVSEIETGTVKPTLSTFCRIAAALGYELALVRAGINTESASTEAA